ncbi:CBS domain-containing protein, partial [Candidatus Parvarchaeota archaeon]|nr:CBS domain-containing protein [Candidatus Parvarchaeota archaeon]
GVLEIIFAPIIFMLEISGIIFPQIINTKYTRHRFSEEEIRAMLEFGVEDKAISSDERKLLERVLDFNDTLVKEVMVSRDLTKCLEETDTREEVVQKVSKFKKNMYPVLSIDGEVVGVLSIKKLVSASGMKNPKDIMDRPLFASKESIAYDLFKKMQKSNTHMAIVVDSNGQFEGVVTMEDLLEEIVGEIEDSAIPPSFIQLDKSILLVSGTARLHDIEKELNVNILDAERFGSVAGFMHFCLKRIPLKGDTLLLKDVKFEVKEMHGNAIERVQVTRLK